MSKESAIIMPVLIFIVDLFFLGQNKKLCFKHKLKQIAKAILPLLMLTGIYIALRASVLNFKNTFNLYDEQNIFTSHFYIRLLTFFKVLTIYFSLLFFPFHLHMERSVEIATSFNSFCVIFGAFISFGLLILAFLKFKRFPILSFGILWFFAGLFPTSNLVVPINALLYEHWLYLPMIGIFLIVLWLGIRINKCKEVRLPYIEKILIGIFIIFLIFLSVLTINRNKDWKDAITFYNQTLKYAPNSYRVINNLGMAYADKGLYQKAEEMYKKAIISDCKNPVAYHNLGNLYRTLGKTDLAIKNYKKALSIDPDFKFSYYALSNIYIKNKNSLKK